jgi:peptidoglycan hydrolase-like protein with peptidoglycan-binding domain
MHKSIVAAIAALSALGLSGAAMAQSSNGGNTQAPAANQAPSGNQGASNASQNVNGGQAMDNKGAQMRLTQALLASMGLYKGAVDGVDGQETRQAIEQFQAQKNLPKSGKLDQETLSALGQMAQNALGEQGGMQSGRAASEPQNGDENVKNGDKNETGTNQNSGSTTQKSQ